MSNNVQIPSFYVPPDAALIALRDKYRRLAIETWDRFQAMLAKSGITKFEQKALGRRMLVLQARRDYYIGAAESISVLLGSEDAAVALPSSRESADTDVPYTDSSSDAISVPSSRCRDEADHLSENSEAADTAALDSLTSPAAIDFGPEHMRSDESDVLPITPVATEETNG